MRTLILAAFLLTLCSTALLAESATPDAILNRAEDLYSRGNFPGVQTELKALPPTQQLNNTERGRFYLLMARLDFVFNKGGTAREWLEKLYATQPTTKLDPIADPPEALAIWEQIRSKDQSKRGPEYNKAAPLGRDADGAITPAGARSTQSGSMTWYYSLLAIPVAVAILPPNEDARLVAVGFLAGALTTTIWRNNTEKNLSVGVTTSTERTVLGLLMYSY